MPCLAKSSNHLWSQKLGRCFTGKEKMKSLMYPVEDLDLTGFTEQNLTDFSGNGMHLPSVGWAILAHILCVGPTGCPKWWASAAGTGYDEKRAPSANVLHPISEHTTMLQVHIQFLTMPHVGVHWGPFRAQSHFHLRVHYLCFFPSTGALFDYSPFPSPSPSIVSCCRWLATSPANSLQRRGSWEPRMIGISHEWRNNNDIFQNEKDEK